MDSELVARKTIIQVSIVALFALAVVLVLIAAEVLLVVFGGILLAVLLHGAARWLRRTTGMPHRAALAVSLLLPAALATVVGWWLAPDIADQSGKLADRLPYALARLKQQLLEHYWISRLWDSTGHLRGLMPSASSGAKYLANFFSSTLGSLANIVLALFVGLFVAWNPALYIDGLIQLFPQRRRARAREVLDATAATLQNWLLAKLAAMAAIGLLTTVGLALLDIDLALVLGLIAGILSFIPNFGPIASVIPAALIALIAGPDKLSYVLLLYAATQALESYGLTPLLQKKLVQMPPALLLTMQVLLGVLVGIVGVILATPLTAALMIMVKKWYIEDTLGDSPAAQRRNG